MALPCQIATSTCKVQDQRAQISAWQVRVLHAVKSFFVLPKTQIRHLVCRLVGWWYLHSQKASCGRSQKDVMPSRSTLAMTKPCHAVQCRQTQSVAFSILVHQIILVPVKMLVFITCYLIVWNSILGLDIHNITISLMFAPCNPLESLEKHIHGFTPQLTYKQSWTLPPL